MDQFSKKKKLYKVRFCFAFCHYEKREMNKTLYIRINSCKRVFSIAKQWVLIKMNCYYVIRIQCAIWVFFFTNSTKRLVLHCNKYRSAYYNLDTQLLEKNNIWKKKTFHVIIQRCFGYPEELKSLFSKIFRTQSFPNSAIS